MEKNKGQSRPTSHNEKDDKSSGKKYNFYRKPSIKKKVPEVRQTLTSYKRMLKANPLLKLEMEGKDLTELSKQLQNSESGHGKSENASSKNVCSEKKSLQPNSNARTLGKPLLGVQRSQSLKNPPKTLTRPTMKIEKGSIISGSNQLSEKCINISKNAATDFTTAFVLSSTRLENNYSNKSKSNMANCSKVPDKTKSSSRNNSKPSNEICNPSSRHEFLKNKPIRRSLSAQHFERRRGGSGKMNQESCLIKPTQSLENISFVKPTTMQSDISPIIESSLETSIIFRTPSAYERRSIVKFTPKSGFNSRKSLYRPITPLPSLIDLQKRLNEWLVKRGKNPSSFHHLKYFETQIEEEEIIDDENKENIEVDQDLSKGSYEDLKIDNRNQIDNPETKNTVSLIVNEDNIEVIARAALDDLLKLIHDCYPRSQCEGWLELIRLKYKKLEEEPQYWECRAAIEQSRGNITSAVDCYRTAIVQGAEVQVVDESLDILLQKFSLLNINTKDFEGEKSIKERKRIVTDARNVFKSSIIQFAVQERMLKKNGKINDEKKLLATPVRRSTRLSRSAYTSTPGIKICSSLHELNKSDREILDFKKNDALV